MDFPLAIGIFVLGTICGGLVVAAWMSDRAPLEPTEHGGTPL